MMLHWEHSQQDADFDSLVADPRILGLLSSSSGAASRSNNTSSSAAVVAVADAGNMKSFRGTTTTASSHPLTRW